MSTDTQVAIVGGGLSGLNAVSDPWASRLVLAGSETSPNEAGYLAGAAEASGLAAGEVVRRLNLRRGWS